tara:strand:- start:17588 stop:17782 length:195 start_codon:yes stop_codon:yes gene_type:complete
MIDATNACQNTQRRVGEPFANKSYFCTILLPVSRLYQKENIVFIIYAVCSNMNIEPNGVQNGHP